MYTIPLLVAVISALLMRDRSRAVKINAGMLGLSTLYLVWVSVIDNRVQNALASNGISSEVYDSTPAPLNTLFMAWCCGR